MIYNKLDLILIMLENQALMMRTLQQLLFDPAERSKQKDIELARLLQIDRHQTDQLVAQLLGDKVQAHRRQPTEDVKPPVKDTLIITDAMLIAWSHFLIDYGSTGMKPAGQELIELQRCFMYGYDARRNE